MTIIEAAADLTCLDLGDALASLSAVGFRIDRISPADDPAEADVSGHGTRFRVRRVEAAELLPARIYLGHSPEDRPRPLGETTVFPANWTVIEHDVSRPLVLPSMRDELVISRMADADLGVGRAGMLYRDLVPSRHGGRYIASHIHIVDGGPVPDYVHFHRVRFQLIFCARGWAKLVYEDQGAPFVMQAGDAVLQPPEIRHRVLESSDHLEVVEIGCPAEHDTWGEHEFDLPTATIDPERVFSGQRFVWHRSATAEYVPWDHAGFEARDTGIGVATDGLADVRVARPVGGEPQDVVPSPHDREFRFHFVLDGATTLVIDGDEPMALERGDSVSVPPGLAYGFQPTEGLELLDVAVGQCSM